MALMHGLILGLGAVLVGVPILIHLLMQPKPKQYKFPALRFVRETHRTNQKSLRLRHWLLLLLRCLLILALAAAFARPSTALPAFGNWLTFGAGVLLCILVGLIFVYSIVWSKPPNVPLAVVLAAILALVLSFTGYMGFTAINQDTSHILADQQAPVAVAMVVDSSPTMSYRFENQSRLEKAKDEARWIMDQLPLGSRVAVVTSDGEKPFFSVDISAARKRMATIEVNFASTPITEVLADAIKFLADSELQRKELYVISNMTRNSWTEFRSLTEQLAANAGISVFVINVGVENPNNLSLSPLRLSATLLPSRGQLEIETDVSAQGSGKKTLVQLSLERPDPSRPRRRDGKTLLPEEHWTRPMTVEVSDNSSKSARLVLQEDLQPGIHHGWVEIETGDSLSIDDRRYFTIEVQPSWRVLIVHGPGVNPANLVDALDPRLDDDEPAGTYALDVIDESLLPPPDLEKYRTVFLLDPASISDAVWNLLKNYAEQGGTLAIFLGHNATDGNSVKGEFVSEAAASVLPGVPLRTWRRAGVGLTIKMDQMSHPVLKRFRSLATLGVWQDLPVFRHWEVDLDPAATEVIARFTNNMPSVVERKIGDGSVICMTTPITEPPRPEGRSRWNDLFNYAKNVWPTWMLVTEISNYLAAGSRDQLNITVGQTASLYNDPGKQPLEYRLFSPRDEDPERIRPTADRIRYRFTDAPGNYRLKGEVDGPVLRGFSANLAVGATDLTRIDSADLDKLLGEDRYQLGRERDEIQRQQGAARVGQEFYPVLALMMSLFVALELILSNRFYRKAN